MRKIQFFGGLQICPLPNKRMLLQRCAMKMESEGGAAKREEMGGL
jgi:hypothetical protein